MKMISIFAAATLVFSAVHADDPVMISTLRSDGSTNTWTQTDLRDALGLMNRMYWRDMANDQGRRRWHGDRIGQYIFTNSTSLLRIDLYEDGFVATQKAEKASSHILDPEAAIKAREEAARRAEEARRAWEQANLPPELAAIREAQRQAAQTSTVNVVVEVN